MKYLKQEDNTYYCQLLACVNAREFYGLGNKDYFGKDRDEWKNLTEDWAGCVSGGPTKPFSEIASKFGLYHFEFYPTPEAIKDQIGKGRCVVATSFVEDYHTYLIIDVNGNEFTVVNYDKETVENIRMKDFRFKYLLEFEKNIPSAFFCPFNVVVPQKMVNDDFFHDMHEYNKKRSKLIIYQERNRKITPLEEKLEKIAAASIRKEIEKKK